MDKQQLLAEIRRTTKENGGTPLGYRSFSELTAIAVSQWRGRYWRSWSEALQEAGLTPNVPKEPHGRERLILALTKLAAKLGRFPTQADVMLEKRSDDPAFPTMSAFTRHLGERGELIALVRQYAESHPEYSHVLPLLPAADEIAPAEDDAPGIDGAVYMLKLGKHYKIGKSFRVPQRHRELAIELPEKPDVIHVITTDDPTGIEAYWHNRFAAKRTNGEWFALTREDIRAFKQRRFM